MSKEDLSKAEAKLKQAEEASNFTQLTAPYEGLIGHFEVSEDRFVKKGEILTTWTDPAIIWAYFDIPEARYAEYMDYMSERAPGPYPFRTSAFGGIFWLRRFRGRCRRVPARFVSLG